MQHCICNEFTQKEQKLGFSRQLQPQLSRGKHLYSQLEEFLSGLPHGAQLSFSDSPRFLLPPVLSESPVCS